MSISVNPFTQYLLQDDFSNNVQLNPATWSYPTGTAEFIPSMLSGAPGTETAPSLPVVSNGALQLTLQTYNPTGAGTSFQGSAIFTNQSFNDNAGGIAFTAIAKLGTTVAGMDGGIFPYVLNSATSHNEIDFESLTDHAAGQNSQVLTNIYLNEPPNSVGNPMLVSGPSLATYQTYTIEWFPTEVLWFINGVQVRQSTVEVPQGAMQLYLNFWASDAGAALQPAANQAGNAIYTFDVQSLNVANIEQPGPLVSNASANQETLVAPLENSNVLGGGYDILDLSQNPIAAASSAYTLTKNGDGTFDIATTGSSDRVSGVLQVDFADRTVTVAEANSSAEYIALLYQGALDRTPDAAGLASWSQIFAAAPASTQGLDVYGLSDASAGYNGTLSIAAGFTNSPEFVAKYGGLTNLQFVTDLYASALNRAPDTAGLNGWLAQLSAGTTREHVLVGIADSQEAINDTTLAGQSGTHAPWLLLI